MISATIMCVRGDISLWGGVGRRHQSAADGRNVDKAPVLCGNKLQVTHLVLRTAAFPAMIGCKTDRCARLKEAEQSSVSVRVRGSLGVAKLYSHDRSIPRRNSEDDAVRTPLDVSALVAIRRGDFSSERKRRGRSRLFDPVYQLRASFTRASSGRVLTAGRGTHESAASVISNPAHICDEVVSWNSTPANSCVRSRKIFAARRKTLRRSTTEVCACRGDEIALKVSRPLRGPPLQLHKCKHAHSRASTSWRPHQQFLGPLARRRQ